jgi:Flp pilus assembly protein TadG
MLGRGALRSFSKDTSGATAIVFGLVVTVLLGVLGLAIDFSQIARARTRLQALADAAVLAGAAHPDANLANRAAFAEQFFDATLAGVTDMTASLETKSFIADTATNSIQATVRASQPLTLLPILGFDSQGMDVTASASSSEGARVLDVAMCIDATGSMQPTLDAVSANALNFQTQLNAELVSRSLVPFDAVRARPLFFRDFGGNNATGRGHISNAYTAGSGGYVDKYPHGLQYRPAGDARNYGDDVSLRAAANFYNLNTDDAAFRSFVLPEVESGGGDYPESGLECMNEALDSQWARTGDTMQTTGGSKTVADVVSLVVIWTDEDTHPPGFSTSLLNSNYPSAAKMPRNYAGLTAKWQSEATIPQQNKMLAMFGPDSGYSNGWQPIMSWDRYFSAGSLTEGTNGMMAKIADAVSTLLPNNRGATLTD